MNSVLIYVRGYRNKKKNGLLYGYQQFRIAYCRHFEDRSEMAVRIFCYSGTLFSTYQSERGHYTEDCSMSITAVLTAYVTFFLLLTFSLKNPLLFCQPKCNNLCLMLHFAHLVKTAKNCPIKCKMFYCLLNTLIYRGLLSPPSSSSVSWTLLFLAFVIWKIC